MKNDNFLPILISSVIFFLFGFYDSINGDNQ